MTRVEPSFSGRLGFSFSGSAIAAGEAWDQGWKSELLFAEPLSSATMTCCSLLLQTRWSDILGWVVGVCHGKSELRAALQPRSATMTHGSVYSTALRGWANLSRCLAPRLVTFACI